MRCGGPDRLCRITNGYDIFLFPKIEKYNIAISNPALSIRHSTSHCATGLVIVILYMMTECGSKPCATFNKTNNHYMANGPKIIFEKISRHVGIGGVLLLSVHFVRSSCMYGKVTEEVVCYVGRARVGAHHTKQKSGLSGI